MSTDIAKQLARHRDYACAGKTRPAEWRETQLEALEALMTEHAADFRAALWRDLRRNPLDADVADIKFVAREAAYVRRHLRRWMAPQRKATPLVLRPGHTEVRFEPLGVGLIIGAWNYPIMLVLSPLIAALAAGNTAILKPSEGAPASAEAIARWLPDYLDREAVSVVTGGVAETTELLAQKWNHIFFTGGAEIGKVVMAAAAKNLTPVVLELGGKCPAIVHSSANLAVAARRIVQGRFGNCGQTCTAPDHVLVSRDVAATFLKQLKKTVIDFYGPDPQKSPDYGRIVNTRHFDRLAGLLGAGEHYLGGQQDRDNLYIAPTILTNVPRSAPVMQEEIFGPILPVLEIDSVDEAIAEVNARPSPLALYVFAAERDVATRILDATASGDAVVNDCMVHPLVRELPFGGVGNSGMGKYHGEWGFRAYSNARGVLHRGSRPDTSLRYPPYSRRTRLREWLMRLA
jgi:aldehyde dehydrogenase (NAD+)